MDDLGEFGAPEAGPSSHRMKPRTTTTAKELSNENEREKVGTTALRIIMRPEEGEERTKEEEREQRYEKYMNWRCSTP